MVATMIKWRPWLTTSVRCFKVKLKLHCLEGISALSPPRNTEPGTTSSPGKSSGELNTMTVNVKWKGTRGTLGSRFKRSLKRAKTTPKIPEDNTVVTWNEEFEHTCMLTLTKEGRFLPWDICFVVNQVNAKSKSTVLGVAWMNVAKFMPVIENTKQTAKIHVLTSSGTRTPAVLVVTADILEFRTLESTGLDNPILSCIGGQKLCTVDQPMDGAVEMQQMVKNSPLREGNEALPFQKPEFISDSSMDSIDSDSTFDWDDEEGLDSQELHENGYGPLPGINLVVGGALSLKESQNVGGNGSLSTELESPYVGDLRALSDMDRSGAISTSLEPALMPSPKRNILGWRKRKLKFGSSKRRGEPLLNKNYGENGGDDIDFDRRLVTGMPISTSSAQPEDTIPLTNLECIDFGDEHFVVGSWERRNFVSRDGQMKLEGDVFFATIDQRSERAAGESACTALVAVISAWLHQNPGRMPIKAELDTLIREGSAVWRDLCNRAVYKDLFPDGHFDFDTVLNAKIRPLIELPEKSYIGFFHLKGWEDDCDYLKGAMSFDSIWEEIISKQEEDTTAAVYVVSWNDHFFILKVEADVCYIIDTLGERLLEGNNQAYILRFGKDTCLSYNQSQETENQSMSKSTSSVDKKTLRGVKENDPTQVKVPENKAMNGDPTEGRLPVEGASRDITFSGKESCREFIKGFFAAVPLRELQRDMRKALQSNILHQRLQIEFHYTSLAV